MTYLHIYFSYGVYFEFECNMENTLNRKFVWTRKVSLITFVNTVAEVREWELVSCF